MRLWSIHPRFLDRQGLIALWREGLLAQKVLEGKTRGYKHHPQLLRFRETRDPVASIGTYLLVVVREADRRGYCFDGSKIRKRSRRTKFIAVTRGQLKYETEHLLRKLQRRDPGLFKTLSRKKSLNVHPIFRPVAGGIESWEKAER